MVESLVRLGGGLSDPPVFRLEGPRRRARWEYSTTWSVGYISDGIGASEAVPTRIAIFMTVTLPCPAAQPNSPAANTRL